MDIQQPGPRRGLHDVDRAADQADLDAIRDFVDSGVVTRILERLKSGKEATVYRCAARKSETGHAVVAVKVFRDDRFRDFRRSDRYTEGRVILNGQVRRAVERGSSVGRQFATALWVNREFDVLSELFEAGADVPEPIFATERAILMQYLGDETGPAPQLRAGLPGPGREREMVERLLWNVELFLDHHIVHGDLSPFNVLTWERRAWVIDFPQAVDPRQNAHARDLLDRDIENVTRPFRARTPLPPAAELAAALWDRYRVGALG